jgi:hypothetical protein
MTLLRAIQNWISGGDEKGEAIAHLLLAAREDAAFRKRLEMILRLPGPHRRSMVNDALHQMALRGEPEGLRAAFSVLATDEGAATALRALGEK